MNGNRLTVPDCVPLRHFIFKMNPPEFNEASVSMLTEAVMTYLRNIDIGPADVLGISPAEIGGDAFYSALDHIESAFNLSKSERKTATIIACEWAPIHTDQSYAGKSLLTLVLHTGRHPYVMQTMHAEAIDYGYAGAALSAKTSNVLLQKGDALIFDPTTPHTAVPRFSATGQILVLLQFEIDDGDERQRQQILDRFSIDDAGIVGMLVFRD